MINSLHIQNFQSHKDTRLEFHPGMNVIVGDSDMGKTAVIRSIKLLTTNRPLGDDFRSHWGGDTRIQLQADNHTIIREKGKENFYQLDDVKFTAFGTDVPEEISKTLNLTDSNLQQQLDQPFLLSISAGEVAQHFNKVAHLEIISHSQKRVESWLRAHKNALEFKRGELIKNQEELTRYDFVDKLEAEVEVLEQMEQQLIQSVQQQRKLESIISALEDVTIELAEKSEILKYEKQVDTILQLYEDKVNLEVDQYDLTQQINEYDHLQMQLTGFELLLEMEKPITDILVIYDLKANRANLKQSINQMIYYITTTEKTLKTKENQLKTMEKQYSNNFPDVCPLCGTPKTKIHGI